MAAALPVRCAPASLMWPTSWYIGMISDSAMKPDDDADHDRQRGRHHAGERVDLLVDLARVVLGRDLQVAVERPRLFADSDHLHQHLRVAALGRHRPCEAFAVEQAAPQLQRMLAQDVVVGRLHDHVHDLRQRQPRAQQHRERAAEARGVRIERDRLEDRHGEHGAVDDALAGRLAEQPRPAGRFVRKQHGRFGDNRAGDRDPLRLAAREFVRRVVFPASQAHALEAARARA